MNVNKHNSKRHSRTLLPPFSVFEEAYVLLGGQERLLDVHHISDLRSKQGDVPICAELGSTASLFPYFGVQQRRFLQQSHVDLQQSRSDAGRDFVHRTVVAGDLAQHSALLHPDPPLFPFSGDIIRDQVAAVLSFLRLKSSRKATPNTTLTHRFPFVMISCPKARPTMQIVLECMQTDLFHSPQTPRHVVPSLTVQISGEQLRVVTIDHAAL